MSRNRSRRRRVNPNRVLPALLASVGAIALMLSFLQRDTTSVSEPEFIQALPVLKGDAPGPAPKLVSLSGSAPELDTQSTAAAVQAPIEPEPQSPPIRYAAPVTDALPAVRARSINGTGASRKTSPVEKPFSAVLGSASGGNGESLAREIVADLVGNGVQARYALLEDAGQPDIIIMLSESAGGAPAAWYCDPGATAALRLAQALLEVAPVGSEADRNSGADQQALEELFPCENVLSGRAQTAAALLQLPSSSLTRPETASSLSQGVQRYLEQNGAEIRQARLSAPMIWPAVGPVTSHFRQSHPLGIDIGQWRGNIVAATNGTVIWAGGDRCCSYGSYVVIESEAGVHTVYAHLETLAVKTGQQVQQGDSLGEVGCTGTC